jgi:hypothetical protein
MIFSISFLVPVCIKNNINYNQLIRCIDSINNFHNGSNIYLINDSDDSFLIQINELEKCYNNIKILKSLKKGSADQCVFKCILEINDNCSHYIIIQDSMFLNEKLDLDNIEKIENVKFIWHFTNHIVDWDNIEEPKDAFNISNNINSHTDLIRYHLINNYNSDPDFLNYAVDCLINKHKWIGCFGNCCIITKKCIEHLNNSSNFCEKFINNTSNRERRMNESIFSLLCHYYIPEDYSNSFDGLYYDGYNVNKFHGQPLGYDNLFYCCKNKYISKISFNR